ncbi:hypothetical protein FBUS_00744 [Fasciolopsis buskii]|uniref:Uncharacterized protein n=1 Tax=Fasciolopsis buskii TaxID=27845 RepID=A0A8E0RKV9_9TREM|nr:hypothetical protein FBUS_00744 [Fasciolopsis buski]
MSTCDDPFDTGIMSWIRYAHKFSGHSRHLPSNSFRMGLIKSSFVKLTVVQTVSVVVGKKSKLTFGSNKYSIPLF